MECNATNKRVTHVVNMRLEISIPRSSNMVNGKHNKSNNDIKINLTT